MGTLEFLFIVLAGAVVIRLCFAKKELDEITKKTDLHAMKRSDPKEDDEEIETILLKTECIESQIYVWNSQTNKFMTQGKSVEDIIKFFVNHHPGKRFVFTGELNESA
jgi:hypothetical protein